MPWSP
jgi:hypothetical protein